MPSSDTTRQQPRFDLTSLALVAVIAIAFVIRIIGIDWDDGRYLHPDERHIVADVVVDRVELSWPPTLSWLDPDESPINPRPPRDDGGHEGFAYGTLPVYVVDIAASTVTAITGVDWTGYERIEYIGRALSILLDTGTVLLVYLIGTRLFGRATGLIGSAIYAFLPIAIQSSHFFTVDSWLTFFLFAALCTGIDAVRDESIWRFALVALWFGLALGTKATAAPFAGIIALAIVLIAWREYTRQDDINDIAGRIMARAAITATTVLVVFFIGEPFAFLQPEAYLESLRQQTDIQTGAWDVPFTQQYVGTTRGAYQLTEAARHYLGPVAALLGIAGALLMTWLAWMRRSPGMVLLTAWIVGYALVILFPETKFPRYTLPITPALAICAGLAITALMLYLRRRAGKVVAVAFASAMLIVSTGWGAAFAHVTAQEHTRIAASVWLYENLPPGSTTTNEIWDDRLPVSITSGHTSDARRIDGASINLYSTTPTYGDIALLAPAMEQLPHGDQVSSLIRVGRVEEAVEVLRSINDSDFAADRAANAATAEVARYRGARDTGSPSSSATFQLELVRASAGITTSNDLRSDLQEIAGTVALANRITPDDTSRLADAIERAAGASMPHRIHDLLGEADYYVLASDRVKRGMEQNPWRYSVPIRFYELLDSGEAGLTPTKSFTSSPSLFGMEFPDAAADETFINYDHPVVTIYEKQDLVPYEEFRRQLGSSALSQTDPGREPDSEPLTFDEPVSSFDDVTDSRWSEAFTGSSWGATIVWLLLLVVMQVAFWPIARAVFRGFPDGGWGLTRLVGFIVPATVFWWLSSVGLMQFRAAWVVVTLLLAALASWAWLGRMHRAPARWDFRAIGAAEAVFWVTFLVFLIFKLINPDSWHIYFGGEKPMEFAQINAILRSPEFPPVDPWYSQGYVNYYYYSFYLVAFLIKATGIPTEIAFNLAQPMVMGILASATFSVGAMLGNRLTRGRQSGIVSGLISVALVSFAGNMSSVAHIVEQLRGVGVRDPFDYWVWQPSRAIVDTTDELIPAFQRPEGASGQLITEFPYFTGLYGDLHSHVVGMTLLVLCIALAATLAFNFPTRAGMFRREALATLFLTVIALGTIYPTNAWDLPVSAGLVTGGILIGSTAIPWFWRRFAALTGVIASAAAGAAIVSLPFLLHYEALFGEIDTVPATTTLLEVEAHVGGLLLVASAAVPALYSMSRTGERIIAPIWLYTALTIVLLGRWLAVDRAPELVASLDTATVIVVAAIWLLSIGGRTWRGQRLDLGLPSLTRIVLGLAGAVTVAALLILDNPVAALYLGIAIASTSMFLKKRPASIRLIALLVAGASYIGAGVEFIYLVDDLTLTAWARMNTIFKFYVQIWILLAIAGGASAGVLVSTFLGRLARTTTTAASALGARRQWPAIATVATAFVLTLSTAYPITATGIRLDQRFEPRPDRITLNAFDWMEYGTVTTLDGVTIRFDEDRDVIDWFNEEVEGTPVIAEAAFAPYRCNSSRISIGTGLPSVLGWQRHEMQQRDSSLLPPRDADLRALYASEEVTEKLTIINRYDIQYIVVGDLERAYPVVYGNDCASMSQVPQYQQFDLDAGIATFEEMLGDTLEVAFQSGDTIVYRVVGNS